MHTRPSPCGTTTRNNTRHFHCTSFASPAPLRPHRYRLIPHTHPSHHQHHESSFLPSSCSARSLCIHFSHYHRDRSLFHTPLRRQRRASSAASSSPLRRRSTTASPTISARRDSSNMKTFTTVTALALAGNAAAFWRMPCRSTTGIARIDPLVAPNDVADHAHIVFGGGSEFALSAP